MDRERLSALFAAGVRAADPAAAVEAALSAALRSVTPALILAVGKAARRMAAPALARCKGVRCIAVSVEGGGAPPGAELHVAGHPVPDEAGLAAAETVWAALGRLGAGDRALVLVSGGASALLPLPVEGVTLADKAEASRLLLGSGADIGEMNLVRQQLSRLKGGGLLRRAAPAQVTALILSDVIGDDPSTIGSGLTAPPTGTPAEAVALLRRLGVWEAMPAPVRAHLSHAAPAGPPPAADNRIVGSNARSVAAMAAEAGPADILPPVTGDVADAAARIAGGAGPGLTLWGGETTVRLRGAGRGGRNQELALRIAAEASARGWAPGWICLCGGTDGRDGPTDAAGGLVDGGTLERVRNAGLDPEVLLAENDSYRALEASGDLLVTGPTGTNVADLGLLWRPAG